MSETAEPLRELPSHYKRCFGCGEEHPTGLHMKVVARGERVLGSFLVTEHHQGAPGLAHGGVIAAAVDEAMGFLIYLLAAPAVTAHLEVDYRRPVPVGALLELETSVERIDGRKIYSVLTGRIDGEVHVEARSLYIRVGVEHFLEHVKRSGETMERPYNP
jgi:acyl-coenzyme A thioesterase PaaI-like protein